MSMRNRSFLHRTLALLLTAVLLVGAVMPQCAAVQAHSSSNGLTFTKTDGSNVELQKLLSGENTLQQAEQPYEPDEMVRVSIVLEQKSTIDAGFSTEAIASNQSAMAYRDALRQDQNVMADIIEAKVLDGAALDVVWNLTLVANIISANVPYGQIEEIAALDGVKDVFIETQYEPAVVEKEEQAEPNMSTSTSMIGSSAAWAEGYTGAGMRIAIIDTGTDDDHQSFDASALQYSLEQNAEKENRNVQNYLASLDLLDVDEIRSLRDELNIKVDADDLYRNMKLPYAYNYVDEDLDTNHDHDSQGEHGSHVAGIAAANAYIPNGDGTYSSALDSVLVQGVAPDAQILTMKVFGKSSSGASDSDYMVAIEDAIVLGADSINLSLGSPAPGFSRSMTYQGIMDSLQNSDTVVTISAGNAGYYAENSALGQHYSYIEDVNMSMTGTPSTYTNSLGIASVDNDGATGEYLKVGDSMIFYTQTSYTNAPLRSLAGEQQYILIDGFGTQEEFAAMQDALAGKIAICSRGDISFVEKAENAVQYGAIATIIYNNQAGSISMDLSDYTKTAPVISVTQRDGETLKAAAAPVTDAAGQILYYEGTMTVGNQLAAAAFHSDYYTMSDFSSWGVPGSLQMKPEITAPGGSIYSVNGMDPSGTAYETMSGTSMAAPQVAGMAALVAQYIQENNLHTKTGLTVRALAQSLLMSTAAPMLDESTGSYWSLLQQGSGLANVSHAIDAQSYLTMDPAATQSAADGKVKVELGDDPDRTGSYHYAFEIHNLSDEAKTYSLSSDFFTQAIGASDTELYLHTATTPLATQVVYTVGGEQFVPFFGVLADVDRDGDTDTDDAQAILDYVVGKNDGAALDLQAADLDGNGEVTTYDAHCLLANRKSSYFTVEANASVRVEVDVALTQEEKANLDALYTCGAYIEGYTYLKPISTQEGAFVDVEHSIPVLGFYGNWSDASMFDRMSYVDLLYYQQKGQMPQRFPYSGGTFNVLGLLYPDMDEIFPVIGNPYMVEDTFPEDRLAVNKDTSIYAYFTTLIRSAAAMTAYITNEAGDLLAGGRVERQLLPAYYHTNLGSWQNTQDYFMLEEKPKRLNIKENEKFTVTLAAVPEYYEKYGELTLDQIRSLLDRGVLGKGTTLSTTLTLDNTAPEMLEVNKNLITGALTIDVTDNQYVAYVAVMNKSKTKIFAGGVPVQTEAGQHSRITLELEGMAIGKECVIAIGDYAQNETYYTVTYGGEPIDYSGRMFGFTQGSIVHGRENQWMEVSPKDLYFYSDGNQSGSGGLEFFASAGVNVLAAEYVDGYVYMFADDGNIYVAEHESLNEPRKVGTYGERNIVDMAMNYADGKLYVLEQTKPDCNVYTMDLQTGELTKAYTVMINNPGATAWSTGKSLSGMAIDDEGNFYAVPEGGKDISYLFTWKNSDVTDGVAQTVCKGQTGIEGTAHPNMAWDHDSDILYLSSNNMLLDGDISNMLYSVDVETGAVKEVSEAWGTVEQQFCVSSSLFVMFRGMYIVSSNGTYIKPSKRAESVELSHDTLTIMEGMSRTVTATVMPWTVDDGSVTWTSSDESIATVKDGVIEAVGIGSATITATANAEGHPAASCAVTVKPLPSVKLSALLYDEDGTPVWADFQSTAPSQWSKVAAGDHRYVGGAVLGDIVLAHDGTNVYALEADSSMLLQNYGPVEVSSYDIQPWQWLDATESPRNENGQFGNLITLTYYESYYSAGSALAFLNVDAENQKVTRSKVVNLPGWSAEDPLVTIAFSHSGTHKKWGSDCPANFFYGLTEGGALYQVIIYYDYGYYGVEYVQVGQTDLALGPVHQNLKDGSAYASMVYDEVSECLLVSSYAGSGDLAELYALDVPSLSTVRLGSFGKRVYPAVALYQYDRNPELRMELSQSALELYQGDTQLLEARVRPATFTGGVTWSSSDTNVVTVDAHGMVTAVGVGSAVITATSVDRNAAGEHVSVSATVQVKDVVSVNATVHAQVQTPDGLKWVTIDTANLRMQVDGTVLVPQGDTPIEAPVGGGVHDGKLYYTALYNTWYTKLYQADPANAYQVQCLNSSLFDSDRFVDGTTAPVQSNGEQSAFGFPLFLTYSNSLVWPMNENYDLHGFNSYGTLAGYDHLAAIAYAGAVDYTLTSGEKTPAQSYYVLSSDGILYRFILFADGNGSYSLAINTLGNIGMSFADEKALSMTMTAGGLVVADSSQNAADLYYISGLDGTPTCGKIGRVQGATGISMLYTNEDLTGKAPAGSTALCASEDEAEFIATAATEETAVQSVAGSLNAIQIPEQEADTVAVETQTLQNAYRDSHTTEVELVRSADANQANGNQNAAPVSPNVSVEKNIVLNLTGKNAEGMNVASTNGLVTVTYDAAHLQLKSFQVHAGYKAVAQEEGKLTFAYANEEALDQIATLTFVEKATKRSSIVIETKQANDMKPAYTEEVVVGEEEAFAFTQQPVDFEGAINDMAVFTVATNRENVTYQWQFSNNGGQSWGNSGAAGSTTASIQVRAESYRIGQMYRCVAICDGVKLISEPAAIRAVRRDPIEITYQPADAVAAPGETVEFTVKAAGENLKYQWQYSNNGGKYWSNSSAEGANTDTLAVTMYAYRAGQMYRCVITNGTDTIISNVGTLILK